MLRGNVDQLVIGEAADRRRDGKARDAKSPAKFRLVDQTAGLESAGQNRLFQFAVDRFRLRMGAFGQIPRPFPMSKRPASRFAANMLEGSETGPRRQSFNRR